MAGAFNGMPVVSAAQKAESLSVRVFQVLADFTEHNS